ncbi:MAG: helix-turn-helix transcriptional regulator, partial [Acidimicrobiia bacterium]|nr:helix-turn-helix transcriptional regulator [Acidimicrobiia bacterium]
MTITAPVTGVGGLLRDWRQRRRLSQLELSVEAEVSTRHLSFVETGRAKPSRELVLHLAEHLDVPLRERNALLVAAGYAPHYRETRLDDEAMMPVRSALDTILAGHEPYPALVVDAHWNLVAANGALTPLLAGVAPGLLEPPVNALRVSLHPEGMAPRIENLGEWSAHLVERLHRQITVSADPALVDLRDELLTYPGVVDRGPDDLASMLFVPLRLRPPDG